MGPISIMGWLHAIFALCAIGMGVRSYLRHGGITGASAAGCLYLLLILLTSISGLLALKGVALSGFAGLSFIVLALSVAAIAARSAHPFGTASLAVENISYSVTFLCLVTSAIVETCSRLPVNSWWSVRRDALLYMAGGGVFLIFLIGTWWQLGRAKFVRR